MNGLLSAFLIVVRLICFVLSRRRDGGQNPVAGRVVGPYPSVYVRVRKPTMIRSRVKATLVIGLIATILLLFHPTFAGKQRQAQRRHGRNATPLVEAGKPSVFISFVRSGDVEPLETGVARNYLWFRITNNTQWAIWLDTSGVPRVYGDAEVYFRIEEKESGKMRIDSRCHICSSNPLGAGRSVTFSLPKDYVSVDARLSIEYSFQWERTMERIGGSCSKHSVDFYFSYLPKSVL